MHADTTRDTVGHDLKCRRCGYNLRGLSWEGNCPECALQVIRSTGERWLSLSDLGWLYTLRRGHYCLIWASVLAMGGLLGVMLLGRGQANSTEQLATIWFAVMTVWACAGSMLMATPEPNLTGQAFEERTRQFSRFWSLLFAAGTTILSLAATITGSRLSLLSAGVVALVAATWLAAILAIYAHARWIGFLASRCERRTLADMSIASARGVFIAGGIAFTLWLVVRAPVALNLPQTGTLIQTLSVISGALFIVNCSTMVALPVLVLMLFAIQVQAGQMLADEIALAEARERVAQGLQPERPPRGSLERGHGD
ncbi:MAG: hypothetical protein ACKVS9_16025 [Phycisphaerae bacterium]